MHEAFQKIENSYQHNNFDCLTLSIAYPTFDDEKNRINSYYRHKAAQAERLIKKRILPLAKSSAEEALCNNAAFRPWAVKYECSFTYNSESIVSLLREAALIRGRRREIIIMSSETWDTKAGFLLKLKSFTSRRYVTNKLKAHAGGDRQLKKYLTSNFSPENYYLTNVGIVIYYPSQGLHIPIPGTAADSER